MTIEGMNHFTVLTDDVPKTVGFYGSVLGLVPGERPNLNFPGAWLYAQGQAILHIVGGRPQEALRPGVIDHIAFSARGLAATLQNLTAHQVEYICRRQVGSGAWQVFFFDPNGARVELDFAAEESDRA
jgi:catechol 2,3-dioxygenase-like lactoylglutathione lyase family enzyme